MLWGCADYASTTRVVDGETLVGRPIDSESYALYLNAQLSELQGALHRARQLYLDATRLDPNSPELWTRVGALGCRLKLALADRELERALRLDRWYAPAWIARARCELSRGNPDLALKFARAGQVADPEDLDATSVLADVYRAKGHVVRGLNQLEAFALRHPESTPAANRLAQWSSNDVAHPTTSTSAAEPEHPEPDRALSQAILNEELDNARARATEIRLPQSEIARLALEFNRPALANEQMSLLVKAAPHDTELRALALLAAYRAHDATGFQQLLSLPAAFTSCSPACVSYLDQVLAGYAH